MLCLFFDPSMKNCTRMKQCLSLFFPTYAFASCNNQSTVLDAATKFLKYVVYIKKAHPLKEVKMLDILKFVSYITDYSNIPENREADNTLHNKLFKFVCEEIKSSDKRLIHVKI